MSIHSTRWGSVPDPEIMTAWSRAVWTVQTSDVYASVWGLLLSRISCRIDHDTPLMSVAALSVGVQRPSGSAAIVFGINPTSFMALSRQAQMECVKWSLYKVLFGCCGRQGIDLKARYGDQATEQGLLLYIRDQKVTCKYLLEAGYWLPTPEDVGMPSKLTWEAYVQACLQKSPTPPVVSSDSPGNTPFDTSVEEESESCIEESKTMYTQLEEREKLSSRGLVPGDIMEQIKTLFRAPVAPWQDLLIHKEVGAGQQLEVPTRKRLSRRGNVKHYHGHKRIGSCYVIAICDTSGSRCNRQIATLTPELKNMIGRGARVAIAQIDTQVQDATEYTGYEDTLDLFGRGGTVLQPAINQLDEIVDKVGFERCDLLVIATDGETDDLDVGDINTIVLLDEGRLSPSEYAKHVKGSSVDVITMNLPPIAEDPNANSSGN